MGKKYHARVVINESPVYNLGGDTSRWLKQQADDPNWHPLDSDKSPVTIGTGRFDKHEVKTVTLIFIARTPGGSRRVDMMYQYVYNPDGIIDRYNTTFSRYSDNKWLPVYFKPDDFMYRTTLNRIDLSVKFGEDPMWKLQEAPEKVSNIGILGRAKTKAFLWLQRHITDQ